MLFFQTSSALSPRLAAWTSIAMCALGASAIDAANQETATLVTSNGVTKLAVEGPRPVATAVRTLISNYGAMISYEDPPYAYAGDLQDVSDKVRRNLDQYPPGQVSNNKVIVPMGGKLVLSTHSADIALLLNQIVQTQSESNTGGSFRVEQQDGFFHVVPTQWRDVDGTWVEATPILDLPISLSVQDRSDDDLIEAIRAAISSAAGFRVNIGSWLRKGTAEPVKYYFGAENEPARSVLARALIAIAANRGNLTWLLLYDPDQEPSKGRYFLNIISVPSQPSAIAPSPKLRTLMPSVGGGGTGAQ